MENGHEATRAQLRQRQWECRVVYGFKGISGSASVEPEGLIAGGGTSPRMTLQFYIRLLGGQWTRPGLGRLSGKIVKIRTVGGLVTMG